MKTTYVHMCMGVYCRGNYCKNSGLRIPSSYGNNDETVQESFLGHLVFCSTNSTTKSATYGFCLTGLLDWRSGWVYEKKLLGLQQQVFINKNPR